MRILLVLLFSIFGIFTCAHAQDDKKAVPTERLIFEMYADGGHSQSYLGFSQLSPNISFFARQKTRFHLGSNFLFTENTDQVFNAFGFSIQHRLFQKEYKKLFISAGHLHVLPTEYIRDNFYFVRLEYTNLRWKLHFGNNRRDTKLSKNALNNSGYKGDNTKLTDNRNSIYHFGWWVKPVDNKWNVHIAGTNFDRYLLDIETKPTLLVLGEYKTEQKINYFAQINLRTAGSFNLAANYFSVLIRGGITWNVF